MAEEILINYHARPYRLKSYEAPHFFLSYCELAYFPFVESAFRSSHQNHHAICCLCARLLPQALRAEPLHSYHRTIWIL